MDEMAKEVSELKQNVEVLKQGQERLEQRQMQLEQQQERLQQMQVLFITCFDYVIITYFDIFTPINNPVFKLYHPTIPLQNSQKERPEDRPL
jgi:uncharacterized membrane protein (DUF106 family)